jgi:fructose-1,6-bisphosphatase/inositol monophosphatase family enzyme
VVGTNLGYRRDDEFIHHALETQRRLMKANLRGMRMIGSAVYAMTSVASGRTTCFFEFGPQPWDACAAACIVVEAGGVAMSMDGSPLDLCNRQYLMASSLEMAHKVFESPVLPPAPSSIRAHLSWFDSR